MIELKSATILSYDEIEIDEDGRGFSWDGGRLDFADCVVGGHHTLEALRRDGATHFNVGVRDIAADPPYFEFNVIHPVVVTFPRKPATFFAKLRSLASDDGMLFHQFKAALKGFGWITKDRS